jgi:NADH:ubiquinone oxidoreductase subunit 5 (subunit L)/multisubunit Na+/H+ antiporter MnhA subunit
MMTVLKWIATALVTALAWLVTGYAVEYLRPYKKIGMGAKKN